MVRGRSLVFGIWCHGGFRSAREQHTLDLLTAARFRVFPLDFNYPAPGSKQTTIYSMSERYALWSVAGALPVLEKIGAGAWGRLRARDTRSTTRPARGTTGKVGCAWIRIWRASGITLGSSRCWPPWSTAPASRAASFPIVLGERVGRRELHDPAVDDVGEGDVARGIDRQVFGERDQRGCDGLLGPVVQRLKEGKNREGGAGRSSADLQAKHGFPRSPTESWNRRPSEAGHAYEDGGRRRPPPRGPD